MTRAIRRATTVRDGPTIAIPTARVASIAADRRTTEGFFERAGDEIASWFGDDDAERRRHQDAQREGGSSRGSHFGDHRSDDNRSWRERSFGNDRPDDSRSYDRGYGRDYDRDRSSGPGRYGLERQSRRICERRVERARLQSRLAAGTFGTRFRPTAPTARSIADGRIAISRWPAITAAAAEVPDQGRDYGPSQSKWAEDEYRGTSRAGSANWSDKSREDRSDVARGPV